MNDEEMTLSEAKSWLREQVRNGGARCPCCTQNVKVYRRSLPSATARTMIAMYHQDEGRDYVYLPTLLDTIKKTAYQGGYATYGHYWGLMERQDGRRDDGSNRVGWWRLTDLGRSFVRGTATVPRYAHIYDSRLLSFSGPQFSIRQALGTRFDYDELMSS